MVALPHGPNDPNPEVCDICEGPLPEMFLLLGRPTRFHVVCSDECFHELAQLIVLTAEHGRGEHRG